MQRAWDQDAGTACELSKGHGRVERRSIVTTTWVNEYLIRWPGVQQVFRLERRRQMNRKEAVEVVYGITSLSSVAAPPEVLLGYTRAHWGIEALHHIRDVTLGEDRCRVRRGAAPRVLASLRNVVAYLLRRTGHPSVPAAIRHMVAQTESALALLKQPTSNSE